MATHDSEKQNVSIFRVQEMAFCVVRSTLHK